MMLESGDREPGGGVAGGEDLDARILAIALPALGALAIDPLLGVVRLPTPENRCSCKFLVRKFLVPLACSLRLPSPHSADCRVIS